MLREIAGSAVDRTVASVVSINKASATINGTRLRANQPSFARLPAFLAKSNTALQTCAAMPSESHRIDLADGLAAGTNSQAQVKVMHLGIADLRW